MPAASLSAALSAAGVRAVARELAVGGVLVGAVPGRRGPGLATRSSPTRMDGGCTVPDSANSCLNTANLLTVPAVHEPQPG